MLEKPHSTAVNSGTQTGWMPTQALPLSGSVSLVDALHLLWVSVHLSVMKWRCNRTYLIPLLRRSKRETVVSKTTRGLPSREVRAINVCHYYGWYRSRHILNFLEKNMTYIVLSDWLYCPDIKKSSSVRKSTQLETREACFWGRGERGHWIFHAPWLRDLVILPTSSVTQRNRTIVLPLKW